MEELIRRVIATLDTVEVKGKTNIEKILGCMKALEKIADAIKQNREELKTLEHQKEGDAT